MLLLNILKSYKWKEGVIVLCIFTGTKLEAGATEVTVPQFYFI